MKLSKYKAGSLTVETELPAIGDLEALNDQAIRAVDSLPETLKTADNVGKVFLLKTSAGNYAKNTYYQLIVDSTDPDAPTFKFVEFGTSGVETLEKLVQMVENYPTYRNSLPEPGAGVLVQYMYSDKAAGGQVCNTKALVESNSAQLETISTPWTILGYNKTIPQYVKYRRRGDDGAYEYRYVSSVDDTTMEAIVDGRATTVAVKHGFENAHLIDECDQTGLLRPIAAGAKTYARDNAGIGFGETSKFEATGEAVTEISEEVAEGITGNEGAPHTYGNVNPYDCPKTITVGGLAYEFCGYTVTLHSVNILAGSSDGKKDYALCQFDAPEKQFAEAFNRFENGKEYYKRDGSVFTKMETAKEGDPIVEEDVYVRDGDTFTCKSSYVQENHTYSSDGVTAGALITDTSLSIQNNLSCDFGCGKWSQSDIRAYVNSDVGSAEYAWKAQNPFETAPKRDDMSACNGMLLKLAKDSEFLKYLCPAVNRTTVFDKQYGTGSAWKGSFVAYKNLENTTLDTRDKKVYRTHDVDRLFMLSYGEAGYTKENTGFDAGEATSTFYDVYPRNTKPSVGSTTPGDMDTCRVKYKYNKSGGLDAAAQAWIGRSGVKAFPHNSNNINGRGICTVARGEYKNGIAPACVLY